MWAKEVSVRWLKASRALKKKDQIYGQMLAEMAKKHFRKVFYALYHSPSTLSLKHSIQSFVVGFVPSG